MRKILYVFLLLLFACQVSSFSEEIEINSSVLIANPDQDFFVIGSGEEEGVEIGDGLIVHREGEKIAEAYIIEVRPNVSAAEILELESGMEIQESDEVLIVKNTEDDSEEERDLSKRPRSKWTNLLGMESSGPATPAVKTFSQKEITEISRVSPEGFIEGDTISLDIQNVKSSVFSYAGMVLRENGFSVVSSSRADGLILATKPIELSILKELWADARAAIGHNLVVSLEVKDKGRSCVLTATSFKEHFQKRKYVKRPVNRDSRYYNEITDIVLKIKERSKY
ncbi:MAG: hypothetical protein KKD90_06805 [Candidatus Omnitrophica bacterium]|nr:hypothetical protein [Candidatus Omnitrophota bacterium]MBU3912275.1 hypothetical protein [Candidatus Omnitrophota bacterium]